MKFDEYRKIISRIGSLIDTAELTEMSAKPLALIFGASYLDLIPAYLAYVFVAMWVTWNYALLPLNRRWPLNSFGNQLKAMILRLLWWK